MIAALQSCLHDLSALGPGGVLALVSALFLAGLAGGATHCAAMCAPFVLAQLRPDNAGGAMLQRLSGAALLPYHAGRMLGYATLGALAGAGAGLFSQITGLRWLLALLLAAAALLMAAQAAERLGLAARLHLPALPLPAALNAPLHRLLTKPGGRSGFALGVLLSALPCGLLYAALAAAAASGSALGGALGSLADDDWLWGGDLAAIHTTITHGIRNQDSDEARLSMMPVFGNGILTPAQISDVTEYVLALSERSTNPEATTRGATLFTENCTACHGDAGRGNPEFGAPNLTDRIWLHGAERSQIQASITRPRMGVMPAFNQRLDPAVVNMLAVYVHSLGGGR